MQSLAEELALPPTPSPRRGRVGCEAKSIWSYLLLRGLVPAPPVPAEALTKADAPFLMLLRIQCLSAVEVFFRFHHVREEPCRQMSP